MHDASLRSSRSIHERTSAPATVGDFLDLGSMLPVRTGMPELCRLGLSEVWLLKACGHRHWMALAAAFGVERPDFRDMNGARLYPAFTGITTSNARLESVGEDALIDFSVTLHRTNKTCFRSEMTVTADRAIVAELVIDSAFIRREIMGVNGSARRGIVAGPCSLPPPAPGSRQFRSPSSASSGAVAELILEPSPHEDFNGVGFLYCASFLAMLDRAEWAWLRHANPLAATRKRSIMFLGNLELEDRVKATLHDHVRNEAGFSHRIELHRVSDGAVICKAMTERAFVSTTDLLRHVA